MPQAAAPDPAPTSAPASAPASAATGHAARFLDAFRRELATTERVLRAFPADQAEFRPHERSNSARQLGWTFVVEAQLMLRAVRGEQLIQGGGFPPAPEAWDAVVESVLSTRDEVVAAIEAGGDQALAGTTHFFVAPKQTGDIPVESFLWFLLHDHIHHRGQLSVYVRMAGGKVPSIYGPSADEPWF